MVYPLQLQREGRALAGFIAFSEAGIYDQMAGRLDTLLHPHEQQMLAAMSSEARRKSFILGRHTAKAALAALQPGEAPRAMDIAWGVFGQPLIRHGSAPPPELSIAHTDDAAVAVVCEAGHPIGVDLETIAPPREIREADVCASGERDLLRQAGLPDPADLLLGWTIKEALAKVLRCGLMTPLAILQLESLEPRNHGALVAVFRNFPQYRAVAWRLPGRLLAIALPRRTEVGFSPPADVLSQLDDPRPAQGSS